MIVGKLLRGRLIANTTKGLKGSDEKGNVKVGRSCARKTVEAKLSGKSLLREEDNSEAKLLSRSYTRKTVEAKLLGKSLLREEGDSKALVESVALVRGK